MTIDIDHMDNHYATEPVMVGASISNDVYDQVRTAANRLHVPVSRLIGVFIEEGMRRLETAQK